MITGGSKMSKNSDKIKKWRERTKCKIIKAMGEKCCICGFNKYYVAMELHHLDPKKKELSFGDVISNPKAWSRITKELRKCVLLCSNCHKGVHKGMVNVPQDAPRFDEKYLIGLGVDGLWSISLLSCENLS